MPTEAYRRIYEHPRFQELVTKRNSFAYTLAIIMLVIYYGFILLVAYGKGFLGARIGTGVMTVGIPLALGVIISAFVLTAIYVQRANGRFDEMTDDLTRAFNQ